jgi:transcriptional regulator with XRE-family HTH domain
LAAAGLDIRRGRPRGRRPAEHGAAIRLYKRGRSLKSVGERLGLTALQVARILERYGVARRPAGAALFVFGMTPAGRRRFAVRLRDQRVRAGLTQAELCTFADIRRVTLSALESARQAPTRRTVLSLARALGVHPGDLLPTDAA